MKGSAKLWSWAGNPAVWVASAVLTASGLELAAQYTYKTNPNLVFGLTGSEVLNELSLWWLSARATELGAIVDPIKRESLCQPNSGVARKVATQTPTNARIFMTGVLGTNATDASGIYLFLQNYVFPKEVEISLDGKAVFDGSVFRGVPGDSADAIWDKGFDYVVVITARDNLRLIHLGPVKAPQ